MASNGLYNKAKKGTCRICQRVRDTEKHLKEVGEVHHGYATGHIWECIDIKDCDKVSNEKLNREISGVIKERIKNALKNGHFSEYMVAV